MNLAAAATQRHSDIEAQRHGGTAARRHGGTAAQQTAATHATHFSLLFCQRQTFYSWGSAHTQENEEHTPRPPPPPDTRRKLLPGLQDLPDDVLRRVRDARGMGAHDQLALAALNRNTRAVAPPRCERLLNDVRKACPVPGAAGDILLCPRHLALSVTQRLYRTDRR